MTREIICFFQYSPERFKNPYVISGIVIMFFGLLLLFSLEKIIMFFYLKKNNIIQVNNVSKAENMDENIDCELNEKIEELMQDVESKNKIETIQITIKFIAKIIAFCVISIGAILAVVGI